MSRAQEECAAVSEPPLAPFLGGWITLVGGQVESAAQCMSPEVQGVGLGMYSATRLVQETQ